jgi:hypothetical protein
MENFYFNNINKCRFMEAELQWEDTIECNGIILVEDFFG